MIVNKALLSGIAFALVCTATGGAGAPETPTVLNYGCADLVVIGRIKNLGSAAALDNADLLGRASVSMSVTIRKVIRNREVRSIVPASGIAHSYMRGDRDFLIVLRPAGEHEYAVQSAALWQAHPRPALADHCTQ